MANKSYKHWIIVALMCCLSASSIGVCSNAAGVFYSPVAESLGILKGTFAFHATLSALASAATALMMPKLMRRHSFKILLWIGVILAGGSTLLMAFSSQVWMFYILGIIRGIGMGIYSLVPLTIIISNWFYEKHGIATSIALSFSGLSGAVFSPLLSYVITSYSWQTAYVFMGICIIGTALPAMLVPWTVKPQDSNLLPYGYHETITRTGVVQNSSFKYVTISFICMCVFSCLHTAITGIPQHFSGLATSVGMSAAVGATMMSCAMFGNILSKLLIGILSDLLNPVKSCVIMILVNALSIVFMYQGMQTGNTLMMYITSLTFGSVYSVAAVGISLLTRYYFGVENYVNAYAVVSFVVSLGSSFALTIIGYIYDFTGGYELVLVSGIAINALNLAMLLIVTLRCRKEYPALEAKETA